MPGSVQDFLPIEEIRDGVVVLKTGEIRSVLLASSTNFDLKSREEQMAILAQYQSFLNSLDFHIQLFVQSRKLDIRPYLTVLEGRAKEQMHDLLKKQTREYAEFVSAVTEDTNIMSKTFLVVVPYAPLRQAERKGRNFLTGLFGGGGDGKKKDALVRFEENRSQLEQRKHVVMQGLARVGVRTISLGTEELVELFYKTFNPGDLDVPTTNAS